MTVRESRKARGCGRRCRIICVVALFSSWGSAPSVFSVFEHGARARRRQRCRRSLVGPSLGR